MTTSRRRSSPPRAVGLLAALEQSFAEALRTPEGVVGPAALLWTDADGQWAGLVARLQTALPQLLVLGPYAPEKRTGPAIWLRCVVDHGVPEVQLPPGVVPILYLPSVPRQALRAGEECPRDLQPLVELQFRGRPWHQKNGRDWTVDAFLGSEDGLGLDVAQDAKTQEALLRALPLLAEAPLDSLWGHRLEAEDFDKLAVNDPIRDLLRWMGTGDDFRVGENAERWAAFCSICKNQLQFDPEKKSPSDAARALMEGTGKFQEVWHRFREAPKLYPGVSQLLREYSGQLKLGFNPERDPRSNDEAEQRLRKELGEIANLPHEKAIQQVLALEAAHGVRRGWVWAQLGESPLAAALEPLSRLATACSTTLGGATLAAMAEAYASSGWRADRAAVEALVSVTAPGEGAIVSGALRAIYLPWLDASARHFQALLHSSEAAARSMVSGSEQEKDACFLFADGLRFDVAAMLADRLAAKGLRTRLQHRLAPMPTVTATAKPFATIVHEQLEGGADVVDFCPRIKNSAQAATAQRLRDEMESRGLDLLGTETRPAKAGTTGGWLEAGRLDELGHKLGSRVASQLEIELDGLVDQVLALLDSGWTRIRVVTDHGWLLLPGGLPRVDLPTHLTETKWSRCATVKGHATPNVPVHLWHWNTHVRIASPPGVACFAQNVEYSHGGVSPQECIVPELIIERGGTSSHATITAVSWRGMRCRVTVDTNDPSVRIDLRLKLKQANSSIVAAPKEVGPAGEASLVVDDSHENDCAAVVVVDAAGTVLDHKPTTVGETS